VRDESYDGGPFYNRIRELIGRYENRDLEDYLLALLGLVVKSNLQPMTEGLFFKLLEDAYTAPPVPFDETWLACCTPPDDDWLNRKLEMHEPLFGLNEKAYQYSIDALHFQIAELRKMRGKQLDNELRYFGVISPTGNRWYNFDPHALLECGAAGLGSIKYEWSDIGELLEMGRIYE